MATAAFSSSEVATFWRYLESSLDHLIDLAVSLDSEAIQWKPPAPEANSIAVMATHTLGNVRENILEILCGEAVRRDREAEFVDRAMTGETLAAQWADLRERLLEALAAVSDAELDRRRTHLRRGELDGREVLIVATRHAAEHLGQAELTRDLWIASRG
jgi:hypothetical protein